MMVTGPAIGAPGAPAPRSSPADVVVAFYRSVGEGGSWNRRGAWVVGRGPCGRAHVRAVLAASAYGRTGTRSTRRPLHASSRQASSGRTTTERGSGQNLYEDKTSLVIEEVSRRRRSPSARVREIHREQLPSSKPSEDSLGPGLPRRRAASRPSARACPGCGPSHRARARGRPPRAGTCARRGDVARRRREVCERLQPRAVGLHEDARHAGSAGRELL